MTIEEQLKALQDVAAQQKALNQSPSQPHQSGVCPSCGYCPHCGRGQQLGPYYPQPYYQPWQWPPAYPQYWYSGTVTAVASNVSGNLATLQNFTSY